MSKLYPLLINILDPHLTKAITSGNIEELKILHEIVFNNNLVDKFPDLCCSAAEYGQLDCLIFLHTNGYAWGYDTPRYSARKGHLECLKYLHENGCPWDEETTAEAEEKNHIACLIYAVKNGCPTTYDDDF